MIKLLNGGKPYIWEENICPIDIFKIILNRERSRADRDNQEFSLIILCFNETMDNRSANRFIQTLKSRSRTIDRFGWLDEKHIGVILPNTQYRGGMKFVNDVYNLSMPYGQLPDYTIYNYPSKWFEDGRIPSLEEQKSKDTEVHNTVDTSCSFVVKIPVWKRVTDILVAGLLMILFSPVILFMILVIKVVSPGPVLFKQVRIGQGGKPFSFLKFRTMRTGSDRELHEKHSRDFIKFDRSMDKLDDRDNRIIPLGKFFRGACLDELAQLINVFRGEMSIVGPRPCTAYEAEEYLRWHKQRFDAVPGITGIWQVVSDKNKLAFSQMVRLDKRYIESMSFWRDLLIMLKTPLAILSMLLDGIKVTTRK